MNSISLAKHFLLVLVVCASFLEMVDSKKHSRADRYKPTMLSQGEEPVNEELAREASLLNYHPEQDHTTRKSNKKLRPRGQKPSQDPKVELDLQDILETLEDLGLDENQQSQPSAKFMLDLYERLQSGDNLAAAAGHDHLDVAILQADTVRSLPPQEERKKLDLLLKFNLTSLSSREVLSKAELRMKKQGHHQADQRFRLRVKIHGSNNEDSRMSYRVKSWRETKDGFIALDITPVLRALLVPGYANSTVEISIRTQKRSGSSRQTRSVHTAPEDSMLVMFTQDKSFFREFHSSSKWNKRVSLDNSPGAGPFKRLERRKRGSGRERKAGKKDAEEVDAEKNQNLCGKESFFIDFEVIGWSQWIVYPKRFNAFQCSGKCPSPVGPQFQPTNHAILQSLMRLHDKKVSRPCCVPTKLAPISMLYYEYDEIVVRHHEDMVVDRCGCR